MKNDIETKPMRRKKKQPKCDLNLINVPKELVLDGEIFYEIDSFPNHKMSNRHRIFSKHKCIILKNNYNALRLNGKHISINDFQLINNVYCRCKPKDKYEPNQEWKPIPNFDGFEISNKANIRSLNYKKRKGWKVQLAVVKTNGGARYLSVKNNFGERHTLYLDKVRDYVFYGKNPHKKRFFNRMSKRDILFMFKEMSESEFLEWKENFDENEKY